MSVQKLLHWCHTYSAEEPLLHLIYSISSAHFPNIGIGFPSGDDLFDGGYILLAPHLPTPLQQQKLHELASQGYFVFSTDDWQVAKEMIMTYLKRQRPPGYEDPRFLPDQILLN